MNGQVTLTYFRYYGKRTENDERIYEAVKVECESLEDAMNHEAKISYHTDISNRFIYEHDDGHIDDYRILDAYDNNPKISGVFEYESQ